MPGLLRAAVLLVAIASCASTAVRAEELGPESPWSRAAIAHAAEVDLFGHAAESDSAMLVRTFREQTQPDTVIALTVSERSPRISSAPDAGSSDVRLGVILTFAALGGEAVLGSMTYAVIRQENGGYYWGGYMLFMSLCAPVMVGGDGFGGEPMLFESLLTMVLVLAAVGAYDIAAEKRGEDRTRMFQRTFVGMNVGFVAPMVVEGVSRFLRSRF